MMNACKTAAFLFVLSFVAVSLTHAGGHGGPGALDNHGGGPGNRGGGVGALLDGPRTERWLAGLAPDQRRRARVILEEERPSIQDLHYQIRCKMQELESLNYDNDIHPDALPRLGWELQKLRDQLYAAYLRVHERMRREVGVEFVRPGSRGCRGISQFNHM